MILVRDSRFDMRLTFFAICMTCVIGSSLENNVFDEIERKNGTITSDEIEEIVHSHPKIALHLMRKINDYKDAKRDEEIVRKDEELVMMNYLVMNKSVDVLKSQKRILEMKYNKTVYELELSRVICTTHFLGNVYGRVAVWWGPHLDCSRKVDDFYTDINYHKCFQYLNYSGTPNVSGDVISRLNDETIPAVKKVRKESFKAMKKLDENQEAKRKPYCDLIESRRYSIHGFCWVYWKGSQIRGAMVHEIDRAFDFIRKWKMEKSDLLCPQFKTGELMYKEEDAPIINLMLELNEFPNRISIKNGSPIVNECW